MTQGLEIKLALPKGSLQRATAKFLRKAGLDFGDYESGKQLYRLRAQSFPELFAKVFHEKDIAVQVAIGNYDLGICGLDWTEELLSKYPSDAVVKIWGLGYGKRKLFVAASKFSKLRSPKDLKKKSGPLRLVSEYPNLAEAFALRSRLPNFRIFPVWGAAEVYPPEHADLVLASTNSTEALSSMNLISIEKILESEAFLLANRKSLENKNLSPPLSALYKVKLEEEMEEPPETGLEVGRPPTEKNLIYLALPDGHQQAPTSRFLEKAGFEIPEYSPSSTAKRPLPQPNSLAVKVVRPQDMPLQVAGRSFSLAITGKDWLLEHLTCFPSSPVEEVTELGFGWVRLVAVVSQELEINSVKELRALLQSGKLEYLRIASEYVSLADKYARENHLAPYKIIPTWGATEAFLPEDADLLIENTQTGKTLAKHNLKIIDTLFESSACLIGHPEELHRKKVRDIAEILCGAYSR